MSCNSSSQDWWMHFVLRFFHILAVCVFFLLHSHWRICFFSEDETEGKKNIQNILFWCVVQFSLLLLLMMVFFVLWFHFALRQPTSPNSKYTLIMIRWRVYEIDTTDKINAPMLTFIRTIIVCSLVREKDRDQQQQQQK